MDGRDTYHHVSVEARMNMHQASYLVSICLFLLFVLTSSARCVEVRFQSTTGIQVTRLRSNVAYMTKMLSR